MEYNEFIYWATESRLHRIAIADADAEWLNAVPNWKTFTKTDASFHPMAIQDLTLFIGDGNLVAQVDEFGTFDDNVLDINEPYRIKTMIDYEFDLLLGTYISDTVNEALIIRWDTVSPSWNTSDPVNEVGINAFIRDDNNMLVSAGKYGRLYFYNGEQLETYERIPGTYSNTATLTVHPHAVANFEGVPIFGVSNVTGNPALQGVYALGAYSRKYTKSLTLDWVISRNATSGVEIGAILVIDGLIYCAWSHNGIYGIDKLDMTAKYASAYFLTRMLFQDIRHIQKTLAELAVFYASLPSGTSFTFSYNVNRAGLTAITDRVADDSIAYKYRSQLQVPNIGSLQVKVAFNVSGNNAPDMEMFTATIA